LSKINNDIFNCDKFFPEIDKFSYKLLSKYTFQDKDTGFNVDHHIYQNMNSGEIDYLQTMEDILLTGERRQTRNAITLSKFGSQIKFNLKNIFPLLTTKKVVLRIIFEELKFFLLGQTDANILKNKNVHIWNGNTSREFLDSMKLKYKEGSIGPIYSFNFRHFGAQYVDSDSDYIGQGYDQLMYVIKELVENPNSRRILMTSFDPIAAKKAPLFPCHGIAIQFYVDKDNYLSCHVYNRSQDIFLGTNFNISSYSLLVYILCSYIETNYGIKYKPGELIMSLGDTHVYDAHIDAVKKQLLNIPYKFPKLKINKDIKNFEDMEWSDFEIIDYKSHKSIKAPMII